MPSIEKRFTPTYARPRNRSRPSTSVRRWRSARFSSSVSGAVASPDSIVRRNHSRSFSSPRCANSYAIDAAVGVAHLADDVRRGGRARVAEGGAGNLLEVGFGDPVELWPQLGRAWRRRSERIERTARWPYSLNRGDERCGRRGFPKKRRVIAARGGRTAGELFGNAKKLAPGLIDRRRIAPVRFVELGDQSVVEDARDWKAGHALKSNGRPDEPASGDTDALLERRPVSTPLAAVVAGRTTSVNAEPFWGSDSTSIRAAKQFGEAARDVETETGAAMPACQSGVELGERLEQAIQVAPSDADPRVAHVEANCVAASDRARGGLRRRR